MRNLNLERQSLGPDLNQGLPEAEAGTASLNNLRVNDEFINVF
jgi:hypothetical protein